MVAWLQNKDELQRCRDNRTKLEQTIDALQKDIVKKKQTVAMATMDIQVGCYGYYRYTGRL